MSVPAARIRVLREQPPRAQGDYVLYWMIAARRPRFNFGLQRALELCRKLGRPLLVLEALRVDYRWASDRLHAFVLQGMADNQRAFAAGPAHYYPYVEPRPGAGKGLLAALARRACAVIGDDYPCFFLPHMLARAAARLRVRLEAVDSNGLLPLSFAAGRAFTTAHSFRGFLQQRLEDALGDLPLEQPLRRARLPAFTASLAAVERRYPRATLQQLDRVLAALPIDHGVPRVAALSGGHAAAGRTLHRFLADGLSRYAESRNHPDRHAASGLSPYLHFGQLSAHEVFRAVCAAESWDGIPARRGRRGAREGFWGMSPSAEAFLDELVTWRELALNGAAYLPHFDQYRSLPAWAKHTLAKHAGDRREPYTLAQLERAETADPIWNAAQRQLLREGRIHNYLRMLWGKCIVAWSKTPQEALARLIELNNKYALDGRDPNSYAGIFWILGRYDRPWGPERPIFGTLRFMSSAATRRKLELRAYLREYGT